jgi:hypothetical protein
MKKILVTVVLGVAAIALAQDAAQPAQGQPAAAASQSAAPVIKDPAEYNAYVGAIQQTDPAAKISGLEAFVTQYPNSIMKNQALEQLMGAYQQANNMQKTTDTAIKLVTADPCNERALALLAYFDRLRAQGGDPNAKQLLIDGQKYAQAGIDCMPKFIKPEGTSDADFKKMQDQMTGIFNSEIGVADLTNKDYKGAVDHLRPAADANAQDFSVVYPLALAYLGQTPPDQLNGIWYAARAAAVAPAQAQAQIEKYARSQYMKYHGAEEGWPAYLATAKANGTPPTIKPAPTPEEQVHTMVASKKPEEMNFAEWQYVFTSGAKEDQDVVWNAIKGKAVQMNGTVISTTPTEFMIAGSSDDIEAKKADITLQFAEKIPVKMIPKDGASFDFQGEPASYTVSPFMVIMEKGQLLKAATAPAAKKPPVHHKPVPKQ